MTGTKILVFNAKQLIKGATYAIVGIIMLIAIIYFFMPKGEDASSQSLLEYLPNTLESGFAFTPGTYLSEISLNNKPATVEVTVTENEIVSIALGELTESHHLFYPLLMPTMNEIAQEIIESQSLNITKFQDNAVTSQILINAISRALDEAAPQSSL